MATSAYGLDGTRLLFVVTMHSTTIRYAPLPPLRPRQPADQEAVDLPRTPAPLRTNVGVTASMEPALSASTSEGSSSAWSPSTSVPGPDGSEPTATAGTTATTAAPEEKMVVGSLQPATAWPSQVASRMTTSWLLPAHNDQSSAIALLLRTEIESHKISKEMLHATEQKRLEAVHHCQHLEAAKQRLETDVCNWVAAYNALAAVFSQCSNELKRLSGRGSVQGNEVDADAALQTHSMPPDDRPEVFHVT